VAYRRGREETRHLPLGFGAAGLEEWRPVYEEMAGWDESLGEARRFTDLPAAAREYVARIEKAIGIPITLIGVGPERKQTIVP